MRYKGCRYCDHKAIDGWHISAQGSCRWCSVARVVAQVSAVFPPDPVERIGLSVSELAMVRAAWRKSLGRGVPQMIETVTSEVLEPV